MRIPKAAIPKFSGVKTDLLTDADNSDLRKAIANAVPTAVEQTKDLAPYFRATNERESCKRIFDFLKQRVKYKADDYRQVVQMPSAILRPGAIADCKSLSLFTAAILQNLGIPWHFVLTSYTDSAIPGHIYVCTDSGCIIDVVWGKFDSEKKANHRYKMKVSYLAGISGPMVASDKISGTLVGDFFRKATTTVKTGVQKATTAAKTTGFASGRALFLIIVKNNFDGFATKLQKVDQGALREWWNKIGGNWTILQKNITEGASKKSRKLGLIKALKFAGIAGITGQGDAEIVAACSAAGGTIGSAFPAVGTATGAAWGASLGAAIVAGKAIFANVAKQSNADDLSSSPANTSGLPVNAAETGEDSAQAASSGKISATYIILGAAAIGALWYFNKKKK